MTSSSQSRHHAERLAEKRKRDSIDQDAATPKRKRRQAVAIVDEEPSEAIAKGTTTNGTSNLTPRPHQDELAPPPTTRSSKKKKSKRSRSKRTWKLSTPMGGRILDIDPIFTADEEYLLLTYNTSIQVYSTSDSLLNRRINIPVYNSIASMSPHSHIISSSLSRVSPNIVWVLCSDGRVWRIDWTTGDGVGEYFQIRSQEAFDMTAIDVRFGKEAARDILLVSEKASNASSQIVAYDLTSPDGAVSKELQTHQGNLTIIKSTDGGQAVVSVVSSTILVGSLKSKEHQSLEDLEYEFFSFESGDEISCLSIRQHHSRKQLPKKQQIIEATGPVLDVAVGCARGPIFVYADLLARLQSVESSFAGSSVLHTKKYHWHRRAVHSVAWSEDGNYLISGGSEAVLVLWQIDTGKRDFLPHLSASIENIVVSPRGSSYAVHLDDNSAMVLSTAEMKPTAYVSGIQSLVFGDTKSKDFMVRRVWEPIEEINSPCTAAINPKDPSQLLICVGNGQQASFSGAFPAIPMMQTFDLDSFQNISKDPLARTNAADDAYTPNGYPMIEPRVTQLVFSSNGKWLATVDEWEPQPRDIGALADSSSITKEDLCRERRESYLKFWTKGTDGKSFELSTRINGPHFTHVVEDVFALAADPVSTRFASVGNDGMLRIWTPKLRQPDGLGPINEVLSTWSCERAISVGESTKTQDELQHLDGRATYSRSGSVTFSEDGSIIFVAYGHYNEQVIYIVDADSGEIRSTLHDMFTGAVRDIRVLGSCLIMLSDDLAVYDLVSDELRYGVHLSGVPGPVSLMTHLAVDASSKRFAVAIPSLQKSQDKLRKGAMSDVAVFDLDHSDPEFSKSFPHLITSLLPATGSPGFIFLDSAAQITSLFEETNSVPLAQPLADLRLNGKSTVEPNGRTEAALIVNGLDDEGSEDEEPEAMDLVDDNLDDVVDTAVIAPERLTEIFDAAPAFAMPPIEDLFYRVAGLFSAPPPAV